MIFIDCHWFSLRWNPYPTLTGPLPDPYPTHVAWRHRQHGRGKTGEEESVYNDFTLEKHFFSMNSASTPLWETLQEETTRHRFRKWQRERLWLRFHVRIASSFNEFEVNSALGNPTRGNTPRSFRKRQKSTWLKYHVRKASFFNEFGINTILRNPPGAMVDAVDSETTTIRLARLLPQCHYQSWST